MKTLVPSHPKTRMLAGLLEIRNPEAVGILAVLWNYTKQNAKDGDLSNLNPRRLAAMLEWPLESGDRIYAALLEAGWVDKHPHKEGVFVIHDWLHHCEDYLIRDLRKSGRLPEDSGRDMPPADFYLPDPVETCRDKSQQVATSNRYPPPSPPPSPSSPSAKTKTPPAAGGRENLEGFDDWWKSYPIRPGCPRGNRKQAMTAWGKLTDTERAEVVTATARLVEAVKAGKVQYPKDAERFIRPPGRGNGDPPYRAWLEDTDGAIVASDRKPHESDFEKSRRELREYAKTLGGNQ